MFLKQVYAYAHGNYPYKEMHDARLRQHVCERASRDSRSEEVKAWRASTLVLIDSHVKHCFLHPHGMFGYMYV